jgi:hypothetical protein
LREKGASSVDRVGKIAWEGSCVEAGREVSWRSLAGWWAGPNRCTGSWEALAK